MYLISRVADLDPVCRNYSIIFIKEMGTIRNRNNSSEKCMNKTQILTLLHSFGILKTFTVIKFHNSFVMSRKSKLMQKSQDQKVSYLKSQ